MIGTYVADPVNPGTGTCNTPLFVQTAADGKYSVGVEAGTYCMFYSQTGTIPAMSLTVRSQPIQVSANVVKDVALSSVVFVRLQGKTTDANGVAVGGVSLSFGGTGSDSNWSSISATLQVQSDRTRRATTALICRLGRIRSERLRRWVRLARVEP